MTGWSLIEGGVKVLIVSVRVELEKSAHGGLVHSRQREGAYDSHLDNKFRMNSWADLLSRGRHLLYSIVCHLSKGMAGDDMIAIAFQQRSILRTICPSSCVCFPHLEFE